MYTVRQILSLVTCFNKYAGNNKLLNLKGVGIDRCYLKSKETRNSFLK